MVNNIFILHRNNFLESSKIKKLKLKQGHSVNNIKSAN